MKNLYHLVLESSRNCKKAVSTVNLHSLKSLRKGKKPVKVFNL